ncbi:DUF3306 domain-containing protein [Shewanella acanthi]|uniref:DUF3306 domain-containing protein n=1 Tax=Shewanella acanthi TaxID=2864212 RepID=UPI001C655F94|nr:DUF3306 domain-containing protein [Shewanella acanthi]QYJ78646.1 DUF3306 domain-containing protein [Shewanella acanthi]
MTDTTTKSGGFFSRWTQRRESVAAEEAALKAKENAEQAQAESVTDLADESIEATAADNGIAPATDEEANRILTAEDLPNPEEIEIGGSFAQFMATNVDPAAKTAALRALWKQPHFNEIDGLLEYALDYSNQPKLSPEVSAELAQKVFRFVTKESEEEEQTELATAESVINTENSMELEKSDVETELATSDVTDNLDGESEELPQNEPELTTQVNNQVV